MARTPKLGYAEGSVYFDKSKGVWRGAITIDGRRHRVDGLTKSEAQERLGELRHSKMESLPTSDTTLGEWMDWLLPSAIVRRNVFPPLSRTPDAGNIE